MQMPELNEEGCGVVQVHRERMGEKDASVAP